MLDEMLEREGRFWASTVFDQMSRTGEALNAKHQRLATATWERMLSSMHFPFMRRYFSHSDLGEDASASAFIVSDTCMSIMRPVQGSYTVTAKDRKTNGSTFQPFAKTPSTIKGQPPTAAATQEQFPRQQETKEAAMGRRRKRGGARAPPGERQASLVSASSADVTLEEDLLRSDQKETRARHNAQAGHESSSSAASRFWPGAPQAAKKVLPVGKNSFPSSSMSPSRILHEQCTVSQVAGMSESVSVVAARTGTGDPGSSEQHFLSRTRPESAPALLEVAAADAQGEAAFPEMEQAMTSLIDLPHKKVEHPKRPRDFAINWAHCDTDELRGGVMDDPAILASGSSFNELQQQWFISERNDCRPMEVAVKWSHDDEDGIPFPLYAEFCGDTSSSSQRREWNDVRIVRKLRGLRQQEKFAAHNHFRELRDSWGANQRKSSSLFMLTVDKLRYEKPKEERKTVCGIPEYLVCPLSGNLMLDPVMIATGKTFDRLVLKKWFEKNGHICPVTGELISGTILRNERVRGYLQVWEEAKGERLSKCRK